MPEEASARTRGVVVEYDTFDGRAFSFWDYGGQPEFHLGHHDHLQEVGVAGLAIFIIVVSLKGKNKVHDQNEEMEAQLLYWRRFIKACLPPGRQPVVLLVGSRADAHLNAQQLVDSLRVIANGEAQRQRSLVDLSAAFAIDCRSYFSSTPLRSLLVEKHGQLTDKAGCVPRVCELIRARKASWRRGHDALVLIHWDEFCSRCREEVPPLAGAGERLLRAAANYLHDSGEFIALDRGAAAAIVVLHPTWLCSQVVGELIAPKWLQRDPVVGRQCLLSAKQIEVRVLQHAAHFGPDPGRVLGELLAEFGLCFRCRRDGSDDKSVCHYFFPALLEGTERPHDALLVDEVAARVGRRLLGRSDDDILVPGFFARLQVRAAEESGFLKSFQFQKQLWEGGLLQQRCGAQVLIERCVSDNGRKGIDVIVCEVGSAGCWSALREAQELVNAVLEECCPGTQLDEYAIAGDGLHPDRIANTDERPCVLLSKVEEEQAKGYGELVVGSKKYSVASLLGQAPQQPTMVDSQPTMVDSQSTTVDSQPTAVDSQPTAVDFQRTMVDSIRASVSGLGQDDREKLDGRFTGNLKQLTMGGAVDAALGLLRLLKVPDDYSIPSIADGVNAIEREFQAHGTDEVRTTENWSHHCHACFGPTASSLQPHTFTSQRCIW